MRLEVINGPNLNLLGRREPGIYGDTGYNALVTELNRYGEKMGINISCFQSNSEGEIINRLHGCLDTADGVILNAGAYTHYSYAIRDAIAAIDIPVIEVHISNIHKREAFRELSVIAPVCEGQISGLGIGGYFLAIDYFLKYAAPGVTV